VPGIEIVVKRFRERRPEIGLRRDAGFAGQGAVWGTFKIRLKSDRFTVLKARFVSNSKNYIRMGPKCQREFQKTAPEHRLFQSAPIGYNPCMRKNIA